MSKPERILIFIPTYNEAENVGPIVKEIQAQNLKIDLLFVDDNSPDGTANILETMEEKYPNLTVMRRSGKLGIGSAHKHGIAYAYKQGYDFLITMDCDFSHPPKYIPEFLNAIVGQDLVIGSRYKSADSLKDWNFYRKTLTYVGHFLTSNLLGIKQDASNAFRMYRLATVSPRLFDLVESKNYSFFFESLFIFSLNSLRITEIPVNLPKRTYGHSKMRMKDIYESLRLLIILFIKKVFLKKRFLIDHGRKNGKK